MIKVETHCHVKGTSACADCADEIIIDKYKQAGYKCIVVTNHMNATSFASYEGENDKEKIEYFLSVYDRFSKKCAENGIKTLCGIEVLARCECHSEFILYGFDREFLFRNPPLFNFTQKELFALAEKNNLIMIKTHPFRTGEFKGDPRYMHGAESFNGHYHHVNNNELAEKFCLDNNLIGLSGTDFHHIDQPVTAGIYAPEDAVKNEKAFTEFLFKNDFERIENKDLYFNELFKYRGGKL